MEVNANSKSAYLVSLGYREWQSLSSEKKKESKTIDNQLDRLHEWTLSWQRAVTENKPVIIMGDLNIDVGPWVNPEFPLTPNQTAYKKLLLKLRETASDLELELILTGPTRKQGKAPASTLDIVLTNQPNMVNQMRLLPTISDHQAVIFLKSMKQPLQPPTPHIARNFKNYTKNKMLEQLNIPMLNSLLFSTDTELVANVLTAHIRQALNTVAPERVIQPRKDYIPHLTPNTKKLMSERDLGKKKWLLSGEDSDWINYKRQRNKALKGQRGDRKNWALSLITANDSKGNDSKKLWNTVNKISGQKNHTPINKLAINGVITSNVNEMAEGLNKFFYKKGG